MSRLVENEKWPGHEEYIFPCDAGCRDYLRLCWDDTDTEWRYMWVEVQQRPRRVRHRLSVIWAGLCGKEFNVGEVLLNDIAVDRLRAFVASRPASSVSKEDT